MPVPKTELELLAEISAKLDLLVGIALVSGKSEDNQILVLREHGHDWPTIGKVVGIKPNAARMRHDRMKNRKKAPDDKEES